MDLQYLDQRPVQIMFSMSDGVHKLVEMFLCTVGCFLLVVLCIFAYNRCENSHLKNVKI